MKRFTKQEEQETIRRVHRIWLKSSEVIRREGKTPVEVDGIGKHEIDHALNFIDPDERKRLSKAGFDRIRQGVIKTEHERKSLERWVR